MALLRSKHPRFALSSESGSACTAVVGRRRARRGRPEFAVPHPFTFTPLHGPAPLVHSVAAAHPASSCSAHTTDPPHLPLPLLRATTGLLRAFRGHLGELLRHPAGNHVVDELWAGAAPNWILPRWA